MLEAVLLAAGLVAGVTGAWSPCGFSMVDTLAPHGYAGRLRTTLVACVTFAAGALAGGVATFGGLALLGRGARRGRGGGDRRGRRGRAGRRRRRGARRADRPAGAPPGARVVAARAAAAARGRALRDPARARLHHLHPLVRRLGAGGRERRARRPGARAARRARLRDRPHAAGRRPRAARGHRARRRRARRDGRAARDPARAARRRRGRAGRLRGRAVGRAGAGRHRVRRARPPTRAPTASSSPSRSPAAAACSRGRERASPRPARTRRSAAASSPGSAPGTVEVRSQADPAYVVTLPAAADAVAVSGGWVAWRGQTRATATCCSPSRCRPPRPRRGSSRAPPRAPTLGRPALTGDRLLFHVAGARARPDRRRCGWRPARRTHAAPRAARAAAQPVQRRPPAALRALHLRAPAAADRPAARAAPVRRDRSLYGTVPTGRRDEGHEPGDRAQRPRLAEASCRRGPKPGVHVTLWSTALARRLRLRDAAASGHGPAGPRHAAARAALTCAG